MPVNAGELGGHDKPAESETPFFCLLQDDRLITQTSVATDTLLEPIGKRAGQERCAPRNRRECAALQGHLGQHWICLDARPHSALPRSSRQILYTGEHYWWRPGATLKAAARHQEPLIFRSGIYPRLWLTVTAQENRGIQICFGAMVCRTKIWASPVHKVSPARPSDDTLTI